MHAHNMAAAILRTRRAAIAVAARLFQFFRIRRSLLDQLSLGAVGVAAVLSISSCTSAVGPVRAVSPISTIGTLSPTPLTISPMTSAASIPTALTPSTPSCAKTLTITAPTNGLKIENGGNGVEVDITACGLQQGDAGWLFDYDTGGETYNLDGNGGPIVTSNGSATFNDSPIGDSGDINKNTKITLVLANSLCTQALNQIDFQNAAPTHLPSGCQIEAQVDVYVTYP